MRLALLLALLAVPSAALAAEPERPAVTVTGEGTLGAAPDLAILTAGVVTRAPSAAAALEANAAAMTKALAALKQSGVADKDVEASGLTVQPQYDYGDGSQPRQPKLAGYETRSTVTVRTGNLDGLGQLIDGLVAAGSNQIDGLAFEVKDRSGKLDEARKAALADARRKAELYAAAAGAKLGPALSIEENATSEPPARPFALRAKAMEAAPTPIARGEQQLTVSITARWALEP